MARFTKPSELLDELDSHGIYGVAILADCDFDTSTIPTYTPAQQRSAIERRGLGGFVEDHGERTITGWVTAEALAKKFTGGGAPLFLHGRGSIFRACVERLKAAGQ
jgi:hypothetical protein